MQILVAGSGPSGGFIGSRMIENGHDVTFVTRPERMAQLLTTGLHLTSHYGRFRKPVHAITVDELDRPFDLVVATMRAQDYETALARLQPAFGKTTILMPVVEGVAHLLSNSVVSEPPMVGGVLEGRVRIDADGVLHQRPPHAELSVGALTPDDGAAVARVLDVVGGRGLKVLETNRIRAAAWERFAYLAAGIATSVLMRRPLRDALRIATGASTFAGLLKEAGRVGEALGFAPDDVSIRSYLNAFRLDARPVLPTPTIAEGGRIGDEAAFLLAEMIGLARQSPVRTFNLELAWASVINGSGAETRREPIAPMLYV
jgi:2-dehydropantoate 2-reductase